MKFHCCCCWLRPSCLSVVVQSQHCCRGRYLCHNHWATFTNTNSMNDVFINPINYWFADIELNIQRKKDSASTSNNETPKGKVSRLLCGGFISYKNSDRTRFHDHLANEHNVKFNSDVILAISVMTANEKQHIIQCAMARLNEISNNQIPVSGESLLPNLLDSFVHSDSDLESFHGFTDSEIWSALRSLRGCAVLEDAETD